MGIGMGLGIPPAMTAGAVISGAVIGDKISPISDSTNLAAGVTETNHLSILKACCTQLFPRL